MFTYIGVAVHAEGLDLRDLRVLVVVVQVAEHWLLAYVDHFPWKNGKLSGL